MVKASLSSLQKGGVETSDTAKQWSRSTVGLVVELIYLNLNLKFNIDILFTVNYFLVGDNVPVNSEVFLVTDFVNLNIKLAQFFRCAHRNKMCIYVYIRVSINTCISIYIYTIILKIQWPCLAEASSEYGLLQ
jgi:hypothetical protein